MSTADNTSMRLIIMDRRRQVAALRLRGYTEREIQKGLAAPAKDGDRRPAYENPKSGEPWSLATIHKDIVALEKAWREDMVDRTAEHKVRLFAELQEVARACWKLGDHERVLKAIAQQRELLGTDAPKKAELTGKGGAPLNPPGLPFDLSRLTLEQLEQFEAILIAGAKSADVAEHTEGNLPA